MTPFSHHSHHGHTAPPPLPDDFMPTRTFTLTEAQIAFLDRQVERGGFESVDDYVSELLGMEMDRQKMQDMLLDGIRSGPPIEIESGYLDLGRILDEEARKWASGEATQ
ncbi:type II toxin-antitoxin system ParD family antitoxin [Mitsuaria sp. GD03876]|uniref:ribbon-helix-helix domain-containing protein n=1 Tax=Mitsuaria sp. GD03876 TaxID=2975399 RepID=UPI00244AFC0D|nr:type II toxin-antitoxin system ParD family antitoxin [Mitsuaria sp. GD03876]MDH0866398.1 type II toxin-antitoxin system ParD family antitoxin [Mitsuaria sp. GD03876]